MHDFELARFVDYVYKTPSGGILHLKNGAAIIIRGNDAEILSSLEEYHAKYEDNSSTWIELTTDEAKKTFYATNPAALTIKWIEVEAVVEAAEKLEAAEKRKSLIDTIRKTFNDLVNAVVSFPLVIFIVWGLAFGVKRSFGVELSHLQISGIAAFATACLFRCVPSNPRRGTFITAAIGYLLVGLVIWKFG